MRAAVFLSGIFWVYATLSLNAQNYPVVEIPSELKEEAYAVVRESSQEFIQEDLYNGIYKETKVTTVLNSNGKNYVDFFAYEDNFTELKSFSGEIFDAMGKSIKKISKRDLTVTEISANLASNGKYILYEVHYPTFPYTVKYSYEFKYKNGILTYPHFAPVTSYHTSIEKASYSLIIPDGVQLREKKVACEVEKELTVDNTRNKFIWQINDFKAIPYERFAPTAELFPVIYLSPDEFCADNYCGSMANWEAYGKWMRGLQEGRDQLPQKTIDKIHELTDGVQDNRQKVKILYEYLQQTTRYVNISLGIGGWQPMKAEEVAKTGFGDCKGLTNYMMSMLKVVNIPSYYTIISTTKKRFFPDFPNFSQANHVILMVPVDNDSIWLECTSQQLPFGYIHDDIIGHDALAVGQDNIFFCTLPTYPASESAEINRINMELSSDGHANFSIHSTFKMEYFESMYFRLNGLASKEEVNKIGSLMRIPKPQISNIRKEPVLSSHPELELYYDVKCEEYASRTGSRLFIPLNPAYISLKGYFTGNARRYDIEINTIINQQDSITIQLPDDYAIETAPKPVEMNSDYGSFRLDIIEENGRSITYIQSLVLNSGRYSASEFEKIKDFHKKIENIQSGKISLKKI